MPMVRCPECGRVADGIACYACGYEWPAGSAPAPSPAPPPTPPPTPAPRAAAPAPSPQPKPPPIEDIDAGFELPPSSSGANPFASPRPVTGTFPNPGNAPPANPFHTPPSTAGLGNPFGGGLRTEPSAPSAPANPFASADGPLAAQRSPDMPKATAAAPMAFDPFEGDSIPPPAPPPPLDLESEPFGEDVGFDDIDLDGPPPPPPPKPGWDQATESTEVLPKGPPPFAPPPPTEGSRTHELPFSMAPTHVEGNAPSLLADGSEPDVVDLDGMEIEEEEPTVDTAHSPAYLASKGAESDAQEPLSERLILLAADLDAEGRHDDANLVHEAVRALASRKR